MIYIVGGKGFIGSGIIRAMDRNAIIYKIVTRQNYEDLKNAGENIDIFINANGNGIKWKGNQDPVWDFDANVCSTINYLFDFKAKHFIHISSVDVYPEGVYMKEDAEIDPLKLQPYGFDKYIAELVVKKYSKSWLILRVGGVVGKGLKKNPIYDITHNRNIFIKKSSQLNFISTDTVGKIVLSFIESGVSNEIINVCAKDSIKLEDVGRIFGYKIIEDPEVKHVIQDYEIDCLKLLTYFNPGTSEDNIRKYIDKDLGLDEKD